MSAIYVLYCTWDEMGRRRSRLIPHEIVDWIGHMYPLKCSCGLRCAIRIYLLVGDELDPLTVILIIYLLDEVLTCV